MRIPKPIPIWCLFLLASFSRAAEVPVKSTVSAVTVFRSGAEVSRTASVELPKGTSTLVFAALSEEVDPATVQVSGTGSFTILGVQHRLDQEEKPEDQAEVTAIKARIKAVEAEITRENGLLAVLEKEDARLEKNTNIAGDQGLGLEQLRSVNDYLQQRQEAIALKRIERQARLVQLNEQLAELKLDLVKREGRKPRPTSRVLVEVSAATTVQATLTLTYQVRSAGWSPTYDIRVTDITKPLRLSYKAMVYQSTQEDWTKVKLTLSSGEPDKGALMPVLYPWRLDFGQPPPAPTSAMPFNASIRDVRGIVRDAATGEVLPFVNVVLLDASGNTINGTTTSMDGYYAIAIPPEGRQLSFTYVGYTAQSVPISSGTQNIALAANMVELQEVVVQQRGARSEVRQLSAMSVTHVPSRRIQRRDMESIGGVPANYGDVSGGVINATTAVGQQAVYRATTFAFPIAVPYSIPSDGQNHLVAISEKELAGSYRYYCTPKLDPDAFLFAQATGWEDLHLLPGSAHIYFEGTYVGESLLDLTGVGDTLDISLGRDKGVSVQRVKRKDLSTRQVLGSRRVESVGWTITVRNNKDQPIALTITDHYPVPVRNEIEVRLDEAGGAIVDTEKGFLTWRMDLQPRADRSLPFGYSVKVPKERQVVLE